jgi:mono/diheme cytochrome c family protein
MPTRQPNQSRNLTAVLGDTPVQLTVLGVWLTAIAIGVVLVSILVLPGVLSNSKVLPGNVAAADFTDANQLDPAVYNKYAAEGKVLFNQRQCNTCHQVGGTSANGLGPRLDNSFNARDAAFIISIVRHGVLGTKYGTDGKQVQGGMPYFVKTLEEDTRDAPYFISDQEIYKITVYLRSIQQAPRGPKPVIAPAG